MVDLPNKEIKTFWETKIRALLTNKGLMADETVVNELASWVLELSVLKHTWQEINEHAVNICFNIYGRIADASNPAPTNFAELMADLSPAEDGKTALEEYQEIREKAMMNYETNLIKSERGFEALAGVMERLLKKVLKYDEIPDDYPADETGRYNPELFFNHLENKVLKKKSLLKILKKARRNEKVIEKFSNRIKRVANSLQTLLGLAANDKVPSDWATKLVKKSDLDTANAQITTLTTDRDNEKNRADNLQTWKDSHNCSAPTCSHTDYDTIKQERDQLKTDKESHNCDCASKVQAKETQIISKIITDLGLSTETERENVLEAVIAEIKTKITPPADNTDKNRISELEAQVVNLKKPAPEVVAKMTEFSQELNIANTEYQEKLSQAETYQQLVSIQSAAFKEKLTSEVASKNSAERLNYGLGALSIGSLLLLFWMLVKGTDFLPSSDKGEKD